MRRYAAEPEYRGLEDPEALAGIYNAAGAMRGAGTYGEVALYYYLLAERGWM